MAKTHLVILKKQYLDAILSGQKTIESRLLKTRHTPFGRVSAGDILLFKISAGCVCARAKAIKVLEFEGLNPERMERLKTKYNSRVCGADSYWSERLDCRYAVFVWLDGVEAIEPVSISKYDWRGWVVLTDAENFGLLKLVC